MKKSDIFNNESITIFTDSSFKQTSPKYSSESFGITAPAVLAYLGEELIYSNFNILKNSTAQVGELHAFLLGVNASYILFNNYNVKYINMISDSLTTVLAIRERLSRWFNDTKSEYSHKLGEYGSIKNQDYILTIANTILANNLYLSIYHTRGHQRPNVEKDMKVAIDNFIRNNGIYIKDGIVDLDLIQTISNCNNAVDQFSTEMLRTHLEEKGYIIPISFIYNPDFDMNAYMNLVY